jgi:hypothetical protein
MLETLKGWLTTAAIFLTVVTVLIVAFVSPKDGADFVKWVGSLGSGVSSSVQEFVQEMKNG